MAIQVPSIFAAYEQAIQQSVRPFVHITATPEASTSATQSKFGGVPYLPVDAAYPTNAEGQPLAFVAQINLEEMPALPDWPSKGILLFFIDSKDNLLGLNFDNRTDQNGFKILYFNEIEQDSGKLLATLPADAPVFVEKESRITFEQKEAPVSTGDCHFEQLIGESIYDFVDKFEDPDEAEQQYKDLAQQAGHKLGGYPDFAQEDPRYESEESAEYVLLFQADTDGNIGLMWGDMGVANFFIKPEDLKAANFTGVYYNWDCA
ncbi:Uncharacterized protein YwqG [Flexibacter flexilis DSM 6793]|uniref:Uncharacterized protein YwqG n=1 Tax=Flexibacter flexilis DSM 6793 TaxID=927664 RepID=A0A1I1JPQ2_9BACT|nr:YwqG family protein [Flexibacter flexilis]SFC49932.1 Uncharacterized protein YwqG [Flexibacter flexilis DSM 6793]